MTKKIGSIKHTDDKRAHIPSQEEAGYEVASPKVKEGKKKLELAEQLQQPKPKPKRCRVSRSACSNT